MSGPSGRLGRAAGAMALFAGLLGVAAPVAAQPSSPGASGPLLPGSPAASAPVAAPVSAVAVTLSDFEIVPDTLEVAAPEVGISVANSGITPHNLSVRDEAGVLVAATPTLSQGETAELQVELPGPGAYTIFCSLPGHESLGMSGRLVVASSASAEPTVASSASAEPTAAPS